MTNCEIPGVIIRPLRPQRDERGWLCELFRSDELPAGLRPVMSYLSLTQPGVCRGPHEHTHQTDLFCFVGPSTFRLYLWDNRAGAANYRRLFKAEFGDTNPAFVIVPPGVVHAYKNVGSADGLVFNAPDRLYAGAGRMGPVDEVRHEVDDRSAFRIED